MAKPEKIDPGKIVPGPIRHESLPQELLDRIGTVHKLLGAYLNMTLEAFEIGFMRDAHPEREVAAWYRIAAAWHEYHDKFLSGRLLENSEEEKLIGALLQISSGLDDPVQFSVSPETATNLIACYRGCS